MLKRLPSVAAALSAALFVAVLVFWTGSASTCVFHGWNRLAESTPDSLVIDNYTVQVGSGGLWIGKCRVSIVAMIINFKDFRDKAEEILSISQRVDVFAIDGISLSGFGHHSATVTEQVALNLLLRFELDGVLLTPLALLLVTGVGPAAWLVRRAVRHYSKGKTPKAL